VSLPRHVRKFGEDLPEVGCEFLVVFEGPSGWCGNDPAVGGCDPSARPKSVRGFIGLTWGRHACLKVGMQSR
jgi:hypothetical protein